MHIIGQCHLNLQPKWLLRVVLGTPSALEADCAATCALENRKCKKWMGGWMDGWGGGLLAGMEGREGTLHPNATQ